MNLITFNIIYKKKTENEAFKLASDSEFQQLKLMICGKYRIYDINKLYISYKGEQIINEENTKLKEIFKTKRAKLEISDKQPIKKKENSTTILNYLCKCKNNSIYICDKCYEFSCELCKKKKHSNHLNKLIKINEYQNHFKLSIKENINQLNLKIINDDAFEFYPLWNSDIQNELNNINKCFEYLKTEIEDIKQIEIDFILSLSDEGKLNSFKKNVDKYYLKLNEIELNNEIEQILEEKKKIDFQINDFINQYSQMKTLIINYTKNIQDIESFNQGFIKDVKEQYSFIKKKYGVLFSVENIVNLKNNQIQSLREKSPILDSPKEMKRINSNNIEYDKSNKKKDNISHQKIAEPGVNNIIYQSQKNNLSNNNINNINNNNNNINNPNNNSSNNNNSNNNNLNNSNNTNTNNQNSSLTNSQITLSQSSEKNIYKLKDERNMIIFSITNQSYKEKVFSDRGNFKKDLTSEKDISQLNLNNKLYMLSGRNYNKFYYYDYPTNSIYYINNTLFSHYLGQMTYCEKTNTIYLLGGSNQIKCEMLKIDNSNITQSEWIKLPNLNEEREEFGIIYFNDYIYVFFGFSPSKGGNLSSIERINVINNKKFEVVYINEQITLSSLAVAKFIDDEDENGNNEILLLGGFNGVNNVDSTLILDTQQMKIRECDIVIPAINKNREFLFGNESAFVEIEPNMQLLYDSQNNVHLLTKENYELFSEA